MLDTVMAFSKVPSSFFGVDYAAASSNISFGTSSKTSGTSTATVTAAPVSNVITTAAAHKLKVGDAVRFTGTMVVGVTTGTTYYVRTIADTAGVYNKFTISATLGGAELALTAGSSTTTVLSMGSLNDLTDAETDATSGDWRRVVAGCLELFYRKWVGTPSGDRPNKLTINRATVVDPVTGEIVQTYTVRVVNAPAALELSDE